MGNLELALVLACVLVLISILASKASGRSGVPALPSSSASPRPSRCATDRAWVSEHKKS